MDRRNFIIGATAGLAAAPVYCAAEDRFPSRTVRFVVPFSAGGPTDVVARLVADAMSSRWAVPVIVENKPGAGTVLGTAEVARTTPDGYTIGFVISAHMINPAIRKQLPYDTQVDLRGVTQIGEAHIVLAANRNFPADTIAEFLSIARNSKEPLSYATPGVGTGTHLAAELLQKSAGIKLLHIPYNGSAPALSDVIADRVSLIFDIWHSVRPHVENRSLKILGVTNRTPIPNAPQYPLIGATLSGFEANSIFGIVAAGRTPTSVVAKLSADLASYIRSDEFRKKAETLGMSPVGSTFEEFDAVIAEQLDKWRRVATEAGISLN